MRVISGGAAGAVAPGAGRKAENAGGFRLEAATSAHAATPAAAARPAAPPSGLLALQSVADPTQGRRRAVRRGRELLHDLDSLQVGLLGGGVSAKTLDDILTRVRHQDGQDTEPGLAGVLREIELRVEVELAKRGLLPA